MKIHHINCGTMCPIAAHWLNKQGKMLCHCLLIETEHNGLVLVETGFGLEDMRRPWGRLGPASLILGIQRREEDTAIRQVEALGFSAKDVRHIVPTHLDLDHAGGLSDFPEAKVHVFAPEYAAAMKGEIRYRAAHWAHQPDWEVYRVSGERWMDFACVRGLHGVPPEILLVPLIGHSAGLCAVAVQTNKGWLLHTGDAYFHHDEIHTPAGKGSFLLEAFQVVVGHDQKMRRYNQERLRELVQQQGDQVHVFCAHDPDEFDHLAKYGAL